MLISDVFVAVTVTVRLAITTACFTCMCLHENCVGCGSGGVKRKNIPTYQLKWLASVSHWGTLCWEWFVLYSHQKTRVCFILLITKEFSGRLGASNTWFPGLSISFSNDYPVSGSRIVPGRCENMPPRVFHVSWHNYVGVWKRLSFLW